MSSRQMRRYQEQLLAKKEKPKEDEVSKEDFEPLYVSKPSTSYDVLSLEDGAKNEEGLLDIATNKELDNSFNELAESSGASDRAVDGDSGEEQAWVVSKKKKKNNRKKKNKKRASHSEGSNGNDDVDEVERALAEVNLLMGRPECVPPAQPPPPDSEAQLLRVNHRFLDAEQELTRRFGPDEEKVRRNQRPNVLKQLRRQIALPENTGTFPVAGFTMENIGVVDGVTCFKITHNPKYQQQLHNILNTVRYRLSTTMQANRELQVATTLEGIIQNVDLYFMLEDLSNACATLEAAINYLQSTVCPSFSYSNGKTRLEYIHVENRVFHILLLKYVYVLTNKACHRTALEVAKILLNLDPSDPLGVIFIIDTLALRAREHKWLVDIYKIWMAARGASMLFHMLYSHALAKYNIYLKSKQQADLEDADYHLRQALKNYPNVGVMLLRRCQKDCAAVANHELFTTLTDSKTSMDLLRLQTLYVEFVNPKWREGDSSVWLCRNIEHVANAYTNDPEVKSECQNAAKTREILFMRYPIEIKRHLAVIRPMNTLIADGAVPNMEETFNFNPYPSEGPCLDEHLYYAVGPSGLTAGRWRAFLDSLYIPMTPEEENN